MDHDLKRLDHSVHFRIRRLRQKTASEGSAEKPAPNAARPPAGVGRVGDIDGQGWTQNRRATDLPRCWCHDDENYQASFAIVSDAVRHSLRRNQHQSCRHLDLTVFQ